MITKLLFLLFINGFNTNQFSKHAHCFKASQNLIITPKRIISKITLCGKNQNNCFWVVRKYEFNSLKIYAFYFHALLLIVLFSKKKKAVIVLSLCTSRSLSSNLNLELVIYFLIILDNYIGNWQAMSYF